jgi:hypothetical protein
MAMFGMQTLIIQLMVSIYFNVAFLEVSAINIYVGGGLCILYPPMIGFVKDMEK